MTDLSRRKLGLGIAASVVAIPTAAMANPLATQDAELRALWPTYLAQLAVYRAAAEANALARNAFDEEFPPCPKDALPGRHWDAHEWLYKKHGLNRLYPAWCREHKKLVKITKAIRKAKAESLFGIGVKLSASDGFDEYDAAEALEDAREALSQLTGIDFAEATGPVVDEVLA
jgi:hypothetical protein